MHTKEMKKVLQVPNKLTKKTFLFVVGRFSQNFIDIREKERKRGARGLVTVPTKTELMGNETSADNATVATTQSPEEQSKAEDMLKLQQKITQELLNSNLKESERNELQVSTMEKQSILSATNCRVFLLRLSFPAGENQQRNSQLEVLQRQCGGKHRPQEGRTLQAVVNQGARTHELAQQRGGTKSETMIDSN